MDIEEAKARLAKLGGAPSGTIPNSAQESVIREALELLPEFCKTVFQKTGCLSNGRGKSKDNSHYWVVPDMCRIDRNNGLFFLNQKSRRALNLLTIWMAYTDIPLDDDGICRDKVLIERSISTLRRWCEATRKEKAQKKEIETLTPSEMVLKDFYADPKEANRVLKEWVADAVFRSGRTFFKGTSEQIRELVKKEDEENFVGHEFFRSRRLFLRILETWVGKRRYFGLKMDKWGKKRVFSLSPEVLP
jgi:hypothetical protein